MIRLCGRKISRNVRIAFGRAAKRTKSLFLAQLVCGVVQGMFLIHGVCVLPYERPCPLSREQQTGDAVHTDEVSGDSFQHLWPRRKLEIHRSFCLFVSVHCYVRGETKPLHSMPVIAAVGE